MARVEAIPNPALLVWARESAGMPPEVAAKKAAVKADQVLAWEEGTSRPTIAQLRKLASVYRRPLAVFYLPEAPVRFQVMHDFRRPSTLAASAEESPELAFEVRRAYDRREWALELMAEIEEAPPVFDASLRLDDDPEEGGKKLRDALGVSVAQQSQWREPYEALKHWRILLEGAGVLTFQTTDLEVAEARGFSVDLRPLPVAVANSKDSPRGRIFTLLHEAAHIMLHDGGICDLHDADTERFCNSVAGTALFPREDVLRSRAVRNHKRGDSRWSDAELRELSREFGGSPEAALVRLLTLRLTAQTFYDEKRKEFLVQYERQREQASGFALPHVRALASAGPLFTSLVMENFNRDRITASDVSDYLQIRVKHLPDVPTDFAWSA